MIPDKKGPAGIHALSVEHLEKVKSEGRISFPLDMLPKLGISAPDGEISVLEFRRYPLELRRKARAETTRFLMERADTMSVKKVIGSFLNVSDPQVLGIFADTFTRYMGALLNTWVMTPEDISDEQASSFLRRLASFDLDSYRVPDDAMERHNRFSDADVTFTMSRHRWTALMTIIRIGSLFLMQKFESRVSKSGQLAFILPNESAMEFRDHFSAFIAVATSDNNVEYRKMMHYVEEGEEPPERLKESLPMSADRDDRALAAYILAVKNTEEFMKAFAMKLLKADDGNPEDAPEIINRFFELEREISVLVQLWSKETGETPTTTPNDLA